MSDAASRAGQRAAAEYLRQLLLKPGGYREAWQQHVVRPRHGVINQMAVSEVLAAHLRSASVRASNGPVAPYQLREIIADALSGRQLSQQSLQLFIDAFGFTDDEASRLWRLRSGATTIRVLAGTQAMPSHAAHGVSHALGPRRHQTVSLHDRVWVGADGRIERSHVMQVVEATENGVDRIPFISDTSVLTIEVGMGCRELASAVRQVADDVFMTEIVLSKTLQLGETAAVEYFLTYRFPGQLSDPAERQFRRAVMNQVSGYDVVICFHPDRLPGNLWWATWEGVDGAVQTQEPVSLDSQYSAHRFLQSLERTVAGFYWTWPDVEASEVSDFREQVRQ